jgi:carbamoyl-phosphate synthase small subunit
MSRLPGYAPRDTLLVLDDGYTVRGRLLGKPGTALGKLVFNTSMVGYQEILTDPSYAGEILVFTFPLIGIYGATLADAQSSRIHARGLVVSEAQFIPDSWRSDSALSDLLLFEGITGISGLDTRRLAHHLRESGEMLGVITSELTEAEARSALDSAPDFGAVDYVREVTCDAPFVVYPQSGPGRFGPWERSGARPPEYNYTVAAYDFGIKRGILDCLAERGCTTHVFPATATAEELLAVRPDGIFLSNGPGDPELMDYVLPHLGTLMEHTPVFGICLGHQLIARAMGLPTYRLKFGNRGANHPVLDLASGRAHITSQNHSYAVALAAGPEGRPAAAPMQGVKGVERLPEPEQAATSWPPSPPRALPKLVSKPQSGVPRHPLDPLNRPQHPFPHPLNPRVLVTQLNVNDSSCEGLALTDKPVFCVQYHPEGCPGPRDNIYLFDRFIELMKVKAAGR